MKNKTSSTVRVRISRPACSSQPLTRLLTIKTILWRS